MRKTEWLKDNGEWEDINNGLYQYLNENDPAEANLIDRMADEFYDDFTPIEFSGHTGRRYRIYEA